MKLIKNFENYSISDKGVITNILTNTIKKPSLTHNGYYFIKLYNKGKYEQFRINRLVATYYIPNPNNYQEVNHIDGVKTNNNVENLEWCNRLQNMQHAFNTGLVIRKKGEKSATWKLSTLQVIDIFKLKLIENREITAKKFNVTINNICLIQNGKSRFDEIKDKLNKEEIDKILNAKNFIIQKTKKVIEINNRKEKIRIYNSVSEIAQELQCAKSSVAEVARGNKNSIFNRFFIYENLFTEYDALNRNLDNERQILEQ